ncbi:MAG: 4-hydroxy-tetrahydrodipicolinate reductase [Gemmatimonadota bacterium]
MSQSPEKPATRVVLAGATGWAGSALARGVHDAHDMQIVGAVARSTAGRALGDVLEIPSLDAQIYGSAHEALATRPDVFVEYTKPDAALSNTLAALEHGAHVVVGTSGLDDDAYAQIHETAESRGLGVLACGNFSLTAVLLMRFSELAAEWIKSWEILDYAHSNKVDAPSGTARELAYRLSQIGTPDAGVPREEVRGEKAARGGTLGGTPVHSIRLPQFVLSVESIFGAPGESLTIRHDAGPSAVPYVAGALLAIRRVSGLVGLHRGLDTVMSEPAGEVG